jgi:hypothetical protein
VGPVGEVGDEWAMALSGGDAETDRRGSRLGVAELAEMAATFSAIHAEKTSEISRKARAWGQSRPLAPRLRLCEACQNTACQWGAALLVWPREGGEA